LRSGSTACAEQRLCHGRQHEEGNKQANAAIGDDRAGEHDRKHCAAGSQALGHEIGDGRYRAAVVHQLAEHGAEQK
jgi:hypothetical protein